MFAATVLSMQATKECTLAEFQMKLAALWTLMLDFTVMSSTVSQ